MLDVARERLLRAVLSDMHYDAKEHVLVAPIPPRVLVVLAAGGLPVTALYPPGDVLAGEGPGTHHIVGPAVVLAGVLRPVRPGPPMEPGVVQGLPVGEELRDLLADPFFPPLGED